MSKTSRIRDNNMSGTVANFLKDKIQDGASLSFVSAYFTINAFNALRDSLTGIDNLRFLFGQPDIVSGMDPSKTESKAFRRTEEGLGLRNELSQNEIGKACADWIEKKVKIKSVRKTNFLLRRLPNRIPTLNTTKTTAIQINIDMRICSKNRRNF